MTEQSALKTWQCLISISDILKSHLKTLSKIRIEGKFPTVI